jgi:hypothetical protein
MGIQTICIRTTRRTACGCLHQGSGCSSARSGGRTLFTCWHMAPDADACTRPVGAASAHPPLRLAGDSLPRGPRENVTGGQGGSGQVHACMEPTGATGPPASRGRIRRDHVRRLAATGRTATAPRAADLAGGRRASARGSTRRSSRRAGLAVSNFGGRHGRPRHVNRQVAQGCPVGD